MDPQQQQLHQRLTQLGIQPSLSIADRQGLGLLAHAQFQAAEGDYSSSPSLMLTLCTAQSGRLRRTGDGTPLHGILRPGTVAIALPNTTASGFWPPPDAGTGMAPYAYLTLRRMEQAKCLLRSTPISITDIALRSGYANPSKFAAVFRRLCGLSPGNPPSA